MRITVVGATGRTGRQVVTQALDRDHLVTAVLRETSRLDVADNPGLRRHTVRRLSPAEITPAVNGQDAVITALGPRQRGPTTVTRDGTGAIIEAMRASGVRRLLLVSNSGMFTDGDPFLARRLAKPILHRVLREVYRDALIAEELVRASDLDWTIVRPPRLTEGRRIGTYRTLVERNVRGGMTISRADLADYLLRILDDPSAIGKAISIAY